jgi:hypothetical protein
MQTENGSNHATSEPLFISMARFDLLVAFPLTLLLIGVAFPLTLLLIGGRWMN